MVGPNFMDEIDCGSFFDHIDDLLDFPVKDVDGGAATLPSVAANIVKELSDFILKRLDHKSPIVKHKTLRLIKYAVGKCGVEFRREMQRHSVAIRQLLHYKGQSDPVKGNAFNKAMRDTAQEAISAIFSADDTNKQPLPAPATAAGLNRRIEGFGNTNFQAPSQDNKKLFLGEVVDIGNATTKQGLSAFTQGHSSLIKNEAGTGTYKGPNNLPASFTAATESGDSHFLGLESPILFSGAVATSFFNGSSTPLVLNGGHIPFWSLITSGLLYVIHAPCYGVYYLIVRAKNTILPRLFPQAFLS